MFCFTQESREAFIRFRTRPPTWWWLARGRVIFEDVELCRYPASTSPSDTPRRKSPKSRSRALTRGGGRRGKICACALSCTANSRSILLAVSHSNNGNDQLRLSAIAVTRSAPTSLLRPAPQSNPALPAAMRTQVLKLIRLPPPPSFLLASSPLQQRAVFNRPLLLHPLPPVWPVLQFPRTIPLALSLSKSQGFHSTAPVLRDHHFDTLKFVQRLQEEGFSEAQSVALMSALSDVIEERYYLHGILSTQNC